jgi:hypothetical protein
MARDATILIRLTKEEKDHFNVVARAAGESISVWIRQALRAASGYGLNETTVREISPPAKPMSISAASNEEGKVNMEPVIPEIPTAAQSGEPEVESGKMVDGEWVPD